MSTTKNLHPTGQVKEVWRVKRTKGNQRYNKPTPGLHEKDPRKTNDEGEKGFRDKRTDREPEWDTWGVHS